VPNTLEKYGTKKKHSSPEVLQGQKLKINRIIHPTITTLTR